VKPRACPVCGQAVPAPLFSKDGYSMVRCTACSCVYVGEDPASIDFDALYGQAYYTGGSDAVFADYVGQEAARRAHARRKLAVLRHLPPRIPRQGRLLDVGCAAGFFLAEAQVHYEVQGVELSTWSSAYARDRLKLPVTTGTLQQAALPADRFDVVTVGDRRILFPTPEAFGELAHEVFGPAGHFGRDGNAGRVFGDGFFDFHYGYFATGVGGLPRVLAGTLHPSGL
jgi:hypothetical protein